MRNNRLILAIVFALLFNPILPAQVSAAGDKSAIKPLELSLEPLKIQSRDKIIEFSVGVAEDEATRSQGLMFRKEMPENEGMLFLFDNIGPVTMWMKNTYIPLDMLFIDDKGTILRIVRGAEPLSLRLIESGAPVIAVLELNAGMVDKHQIKIGDTIVHAAFTD